MDNKKNERASRRDILKKIIVGGTATAVSVPIVRSMEEEYLIAQTEQNVSKAQKSASGSSSDPSSTSKIEGATKIDGVSGATRTTFKMPERAKLKEKIPMASIGNRQISRIILGGNLIGGYAHSRDLIYVSDLVKAYHTQNKCFETFYIAEKCGINAFLGDQGLLDMMADYWKWTDGKIQLLAQCPAVPDEVQKAIDKGAIAIYPNGEWCDRLVKEGKFDVLETCLTKIRDAKLPAGFGAHRIETLTALVAKGLIPDFWMKTFHHHNYWSVKHPKEHDNVFCRQPDNTKSFMATRPEPWIAFKTLAAGAIRPQDGFKFALEGGADFLCVGMYDFQIVDDVNLYVDIHHGKLNRTRRMLKDLVTG